MHWSYQQYRDAPQWFIDLLEPMLDVEDKVKKLKSEAERTRQERDNGLQA